MLLHALVANFVILIIIIEEAVLFPLAASLLALIGNGVSVQWVVSVGAWSLTPALDA
jgi:hypothetical protein